MLLHDIVYSFRTLAKSKAFAITALMVLALGIAATTGVFSIVNTVLIRPAPFPEPDRLVTFLTKFTQIGDDIRASPVKFNHWRSQPSVQDSAAYTLRGTVNLIEGETTQQLRSARVSAPFFRLFGARISVGRGFTDEEDRPGGAKVAVLSNDLWTTHFARDPAVIGRTILLSGVPYVVVGVVDPSFSLGGFAPVADPEVWLPFQLDPGSTDQGHGFRAAARLRPGVTLAQARAQLQVSTAAFVARFPKALDRGQQFSVEPYQAAAVADTSSVLLVFSGAVACVLLIACANVAGLLLARGVSRRREIALRTVLGATRGALIRQLVVEGLMLWVGAGVLGLGLGFLGVRALLSVNTAGLPRVGEAGMMVQLDWRVVAVVMGVALVTGVVFSVLPAIRVARVDLHQDLKQSGGYSMTHRHQTGLGTLLIIGEVTLAVILLIGSGLLIRSQMAMMSAATGFDPEGVVVGRTVVAGAQLEKTALLDQVVQQGIARLGVVPSVVRVSATCCLLFENGAGYKFRIVGHPVNEAGGRDAGFAGQAAWASIAPGYFEVLEIPLKRGRTFTERDTATALPVVIIDEAMARQYWPSGEDPLTSRLAIGNDSRPFAKEPNRQVIGIVGDVRDSWRNADPPAPHMYVPLGQLPDALDAATFTDASLAWLIRTNGPPSGIIPVAAKELRAIAGGPPRSVRAMTDVMAVSRSPSRFNALLMTIFGSIALLLAAVGIYGLIANVVEEQTQEMGVRRALGATARQLELRLIKYGLTVLLTGALIGTISASALTRLIVGLLYQVRPLDPAVLLAIPLGLVVVGLLAVWIPTRRARKIDPIVVLRAS
jgi:putative ABC transport system permease protein